MSKTIATENAPAAIGPYVQGVDLGNMIITSGQIPVNPKTGEVPADVAAQARQSLDNVKAIVEAAGLKVGDIVKTTGLSLMTNAKSPDALRLSGLRDSCNLLNLLAG